MQHVFDGPLDESPRPEQNVPPDPKAVERPAGEQEGGGQVGSGPSLDYESLLKKRFPVAG